MKSVLEAEVGDDHPSKKTHMNTWRPTLTGHAGEYSMMYWKTRQGMTALPNISQTKFASTHRPCR